MSSKAKIIVIALGILAIVSAFNLAKAGYDYGWGPFAGLHAIAISKHAGNGEQYHLDYVEQNEDNNLTGKQALFLGSSVTLGADSMEVSFADYITKRNGMYLTKEAVSGTTIANIGKTSYVERLKKLSTETPYDVVVVQLSTNDASKKIAIGEVSEADEKESFDDKTVAGAMETIISYCLEQWDCKVFFYTNSQFDSEEYQSMVDVLYEIKDKWDIEVIDLWNDTAFNQISEDQRELYMYDKIHPTQAGYLEWWTPKMEEVLIHSMEVDK